MINSSLWDSALHQWQKEVSRLLARLSRLTHHSKTYNLPRANR